MCTFNWLFTLATILLGCGNLAADKGSARTGSVVADTIPALNPSPQDQAFFNKIYFSQSDAERILGQKASLNDSSSTTKKDTLEIKRAYKANSSDQQTGKTGIVYFMIESYNQESAAKNAYHAIKTSNENHEGVKTLNDMGDEAYFHSDGKNFCFVLVRKGKLMFRIKVNKLTSHTSLDAFNLVSKKIADEL